MSSHLTIKQLLESGVHFGHQTSKWNPKMQPYIFMARNGVHIFDLRKTLKLLKPALEFVEEVTKRGDLVLFVATKRQAQEIVKQHALRAGMPYVTKRWMGGMLTNFATVSKRIAYLQELRSQQALGYFEMLPKKQARRLHDELERLEQVIGGMANMTRLPGAVYIVDPKREQIAVHEANRLGIPVVALTDSNCDPDVVDYVIPGNDDAIRSINLITTEIADACLRGKQARIEMGIEEEQPSAQAPAEYTGSVYDIDEFEDEFTEEDFGEHQD